MEFQKIVNFPDTTSDNKDLPKFVAKKLVEVYDQSLGNYMLITKLESKHQC